MCVRVYTYIHAENTLIYMYHVCMYMYIYTYTYTRTYIYICTNVRMYVCVYDFTMHTKMKVKKFNEKTPLAFVW